jgi:hypothetical protein
MAKKYTIIKHYPGENNYDRWTGVDEFEFSKDNNRILSFWQDRKLIIVSFENVVIEEE